MSEDRPRYGEYATPEQQCAAIRQPLPEHLQPGAQSPAPHPSAHSAQDAPADGARPGHGPAHSVAPGYSAHELDAPGSHSSGRQGLGPHGSGPRSATARGASGPNLIATVVLLVFGAFGALMSATSWLSINELLPEVFERMGVPSDVAGVQRGAGAGLLIAALTLAGYLLTLWWSITRLRQGKSSWWIPLVGFAGTMLLTGIALSFTLASDPAFSWILEHGMRM